MENHARQEAVRLDGDIADDDADDAGDDLLLEDAVGDAEEDRDHLR